MGSSALSPVSSAKPSVPSALKVVGSGPAHSPDPTISLQRLKTKALQCQTPKQFSELLKLTHAIIPYEKFAASWGYHSRTTIRFIINQGFPTDLFRWRLATGNLWTSPIFQEWLRTNRTFLWCDAAKRLKGQFDPELLMRMEQAGAQYSLCGGFASPDRFVIFAVAMSSAESGRAYLKRFDTIVPLLVQASQRAYPRALLTKRETAVLKRRAMGEIIKQIATAEGISERTVREHLQQIKKKLYTDDLVNAVVIAMKSGMLLHPGEKMDESHFSAKRRAQTKGAIAPDN
jgi:DNA-binding CsgD family transcriptional regulator